LIVANFDNKDVNARIFIPEKSFDYFEIDDSSILSAQEILSGVAINAKIVRNSTCQVHINRNDASIIRFALSKT